VEQPPARTQSQERRTKNFNEVSLGYPKKLALDESRRCPQCDDPVCVRACPLEINVPGFIRSLREGKAAEAYAIIREKSCFPAVCGRICSAPCEGACILNEEGAAIGIRALERYAADMGRVRPSKGKKSFYGGKKVAVVGSGPAGLSAAAELARRGYQVTVYEAFAKPGGVLRYGIPEFRIPRKILDNEIEDIKALGVTIETNFLIGRTAPLEEIRQKFSAVLLATGASIPKFMDIPGSNLGGVYYGEEFLMRVNWAKNTLFSHGVPKLPLGQKIAVIGSGNTALDCARIGVRLGRQVTLVFRRLEEDMRVAEQERLLAKEEGIQFASLVKPVEILSDSNNFVRGLRCVRMDFADKDDSGNWQVMEVPESEFHLEADTVVIAIGHNPNSLVGKNVPTLANNEDGTFWAREDISMTSIPGVFTAGNVKTNAGPVVEAMASGKKAADDIDNYLK